MTMRKTLALAALLGAVASMSPASAHHSFAMFDQTKVMNLKGTVSQFRWTNPHSFVVIEVQSGGASTKYTLECNSTNMMSRAGWKVGTVRPGDQVGFTFHPLRTGQPGGMLKTITLPKGQTLSAW